MKSKLKVLLMNMDKKFIFLVLLIITILLIIFGILIFLNKSNPIQIESTELEVVLEDRNCALDSDCIIISTKCSACECGVPINGIYEKSYKEKFKKVCKNYHGGICEYCCPTIYIRCINNMCILTNLTKEGVEINPC